MKGKTFPLIDVTKFVFSLMVVFIHTNVLLSVSGAGQMLLRNTVFTVAVPFFFTVSGFFLFGKLDRTDEKNAAILRYERRAVGLYLIYTVVYLPFVVYGWVVNGFSINKLLIYIRDFFFVGSYATIWYLLAMAVGAGIGYVLFKRLGTKRALVVGAVLYTIGTLISAYYGLFSEIPVVSSIIDGYFYVFGGVKNGVTFGLVYVILGAYIYENKDKASRNERKYLTLTCSSFLLVVAEAAIQYVFSWQTKSVDLKLSLLPFTYFFVMLLLSLSEKGVGDRFAKGGVSIHLRKLSTLVFLTQRIPLSICELFGISDMHSVLYTIVILSSTLLISELIIIGEKRIKVLGYLY